MPPTAKDDWIAQFVTELTVWTEPSRGRKFAQTIAVQEWLRREDLTGIEAARRWLSEQVKPSGKKPKV